MKRCGVPHETLKADLSGVPWPWLDWIGRSIVQGRKFAIRCFSARNQKGIPMKQSCFVLTIFLIALNLVPIQRMGVSQESLKDTLPPVVGGKAPSNYREMWAGFDPRKEPLETEVLAEWEEAGTVLRIVRFRIGVFRNQVARLAAIYGFPKGKGSMPGLLQIHGGGQYADAKACIANARRGYATLSIAWAGRISSSRYSVNPEVVKLFWEGKTDDPRFRLTTDWGAVDGYHAPSRNPGNQFPSIKPAMWTIDKIESPRNSGWFLCALAARRAITFLERQPEVDPKRLGVYGHSMGGKLTVLTAPDPRIKAAAPSCGGISDRYNSSALFRKTLGDDISLREITCPIIFLSPANDFHGRIGDLPRAVTEIASRDWRVTCSPHHNHQDTPRYEVATLLWFDQYLKGSFRMPETPETQLSLGGNNGIPQMVVDPDLSREIRSVDVFYTQQGKPGEQPQDRIRVMHRFWHHATTRKQGGKWVADLPVHDTDHPLWVYANVCYDLDEPVQGAGYYYGSYTATGFNLSSLLVTVSPDQLKGAFVKPVLKPVQVIESYDGDWEKEWFTYRPESWGRSTHKLNDPMYKAPKNAALAVDLKCSKPNRFVIRIDEHVAVVDLAGGNQWQTVKLQPTDFLNYSNQPLRDWQDAKRLSFSAAERLRPQRRGQTKSRIVGGAWNGPDPQFRNLRWIVSEHD